MRQRAAEQRRVVERGANRAGFAGRSLDGDARVAFFVTEPAEAAEDLLADVRSGGGDGAAVGCAVRVPDVEGVGGARYEDSTVVDGGVMDRADAGEVRR